LKFRSLEIENLRAIKKLTLSDLRDLVLVAGPNGVGKSCIFDGIKLLKSAYAGYQPNEIDNWFNEFQINLNRLDSDLSPVFRDPNAPLSVSATVTLDESEIDYIKRNAEEVLRSHLWKAHSQQVVDPYMANRSRLAAELGPAGQQVEVRVKELLPKLEADLQKKSHLAKVTLSTKQPGAVEPNLLLSIAWGTFAPGDIGIIDFHSAHRAYNHELINNINLAITERNERARSHALYQTQNKYSNIKAEMAAAYLRDLIAKEAGRDQTSEPTIIETLKELFDRFFPGKRFLGPVPSEDGTISFPVRVESDGREHDVDFLSSGEKEVLFGYLRLRNTSPRNSIILIDEPELHLNPRLVKGLPRFYNEHIGRNLNNQVWLVTHSDTFLRDARGIPGASIWHMQAWQKCLDGDQQATLIGSESRVEAAIVDLVGDVAGYRPGAKVLIIEGADSEFDKELIQRFFPDLSSEINIISAGGRSSVEKLQSLLDKATDAVGWSAKFHAITDRDVEAEFQASSDTSIGLSRWDVYHIENYLLCPEAIHRVLTDLRKLNNLTDVKSVSEALKKIAADQIDRMVTIEMSNAVNGKIRRAMQLRVKSNAGESISDAFVRALHSAKTDYDGLLTSEFSGSKLSRMRITFEKKYRDSIDNGSWRAEIRGRDILKKFSTTYAGLSYIDFRNLIIARMQDMNELPEGMRKTLEEAISS
jgi:predicted ATPase